MTCCSASAFSQTFFLHLLQSCCCELFKSHGFFLKILFCVKCNRDRKRVWSLRGTSRKHVYDHPVNLMLCNHLIEIDSFSYIKQSKFTCSYVGVFEQEMAHTSVSSCGIEHVHCFEQLQNLLMRSDLIGDVARFGTAKCLVFEEVDLKHLILSIASEIISYILWLSEERTIFFFACQCCFFLSILVQMALYFSNSLSSSIRKQINLLFLFLSPPLSLNVLKIKDKNVQLNTWNSWLFQPILRWLYFHHQHFKIL